MTISNGVNSGGGGGVLSDGSSTVFIRNCHVTGNLATGNGGGVRNVNGALTIENSTVSGNTASNQGGGGVYSSGGTLAIVNSSVSGNRKLNGNGNDNAGGIWVGGGSATITNSTVTDNQSAGANGTGGINQSGGAAVTIRNSIVAGNRNNQTLPDVSGAFTSNNFNFIGNVGAATGFNGMADQVGNAAAILDPRLLPLAVNGGTTPTHALKASSPAIDKGSSFGSTSDQRGNTRPFDFAGIAPAAGGDNADIGAFERQAAQASNTAPIISAAPASLTISRNSSGSVTITAEDEEGDNLTLTNTVQPGSGAISTTAPVCQLVQLSRICTVTVNYTPNANYSGSDSFQFKASDGQAESLLLTVSVTVLTDNTLLVTKIADTADGVCDADCSLREAIAAATSGDTIGFASPLFDSAQVITLSDAAGFQQLLILKNLTINGRAANLLTVRRFGTAVRFRIFAVGGGANVTLQNLKITGGSDTGGGGGVLNDGNAALTINNCHLTGNVAEINGGGVRNVNGTLNINNTTISGNTAGINNGAGVASTGGTVNIINSTVSGNETNNGNVGTGGIWASGGAVNITSSTVTNNRSGGVLQQGAAIITIRNSIIAANFNNAIKPDVVGAFVSSGYNLVGNVGAATGFTNTGDQIGTSSAILDPLLAPLGDFGSVTLTHALDGNSPAVNAADPNNPLTFDQRRIQRTLGGRADIGAFENNFTFSNNPTGANGAGSLPAGSVQMSYSVQFSSARLLPQSFAPRSNNFAPLAFSLIAGSLPAGLTLDANSGVLSGTLTGSGTFNFTVKVTDAADSSAGAQAYVLVINSPTASAVTIGGRVFTPEGRGLRNARVSLTTQSGAEERIVLTSAFGYYRFDEVAAGQIVIVQVVSKRYLFQPQILNVTENTEDLNFAALAPSKANQD